MAIISTRMKVLFSMGALLGVLTALTGCGPAAVPEEPGEIGAALPATLEVRQQVAPPAGLEGQPQVVPAPTATFPPYPTFTPTPPGWETPTPRPTYTPWPTFAPHPTEDPDVVAAAAEPAVKSAEKLKQEVTDFARDTG